MTTLLAPFIGSFARTANSRNNLEGGMKRLMGLCGVFLLLSTVAVLGQEKRDSHPRSPAAVGGGHIPARGPARMPARAPGRAPEPARAPAPAPRSGVAPAPQAVPNRGFRDQEGHPDVPHVHARD